jgi:hypothetical protein
MCETMKKVAAESITKNISMRMAAYGIAIKRVYSTYENSGITV